MNATQFLSWLDYKTSPTAQVLEPSKERSKRFFNTSQEDLDVARQPLIMGVLNVTPDSFSDGSVFSSLEKACEHALHMVELGADIIDIGGESSKPGSIPVPLALELSRVLPVIELIRKYSDVCISIDTYKPEVMQEAVRAGANMINDIYALSYKGALEMASQLAVPVCLMHMQGTPKDMQENPHYETCVVEDIKQFFETRLLACQEAGINRIILDPGFGYGKRVMDNLRLIHHLRTFKTFHHPILLGVSRKSTIGALLNKDVHNRLVGSIALGIYAALEGVELLRVHDVEETKQALIMIDAVCQAV